MTAVAAPLSGAAWAVLVLGLAARHRPAPPRVRSLAAAAPGPALRRPRRRPDVLTVLGRLLLEAVHHRDVDDDRAGRVGGSALAAAMAAVAAPWPPVLPVAAAVAAWWWPRHRRRRADRRRAERLSASLPDTVDLFLLAVDAGLTVPLALRAVARRTDGPLGDELDRTTRAIDLGARTADALDDLAAPGRAGETVRPLVVALVASERYGAPLSAGLVRLADDARASRRRRAEEAARRLPVTLLFPLVTCTLPAFALLTLGPLLAGALRSLRL